MKLEYCVRLYKCSYLNAGEQCLPSLLQIVSSEIVEDFMYDLRQ